MLKRGHYKLFLIFLLFIFGLLYANASLLEKKVSITVENKSVIEVLHEIEGMTGIVFSFKSDIFDRDKLVSIEAKDKTVLEVLDILFAEEPILYKEIGSQVVLYIEKTDEIIQDNNIQKPKDTREVIIKVINDTVFRYINTTNVKVYDTVRYVFFDTIRPKTEKPGPNISFEFGISPFYNFPKMVSVSADNEYYSEIVKDAETPKFSYNIYAKFNKTIKRVKLSTGLVYSFERENAEYDVNEVYTRTVTETILKWKPQLDTAYRIAYNTGGGSGRPDSIIWTYIYIPLLYDSIATYERTDTVQLSSGKTNQYHYLSFPVTLGWEKQFSEKLNFNLNTGPSINLLLLKNGHILNPGDNVNLADFDEVPFIKLNLSWLIN